jgi:hypothetical protein
VTAKVEIRPGSEADLAALVAVLGQRHFFTVRARLCQPWTAGFRCRTDPARTSAGRRVSFGKASGSILRREALRARAWGIW